MAALPGFDYSFTALNGACVEENQDGARVKDGQSAKMWGQPSGSLQQHAAVVIVSDYFDIHLAHCGRTE